MIAGDDIFALGTVLFALAWLGFRVDAHPIGKKTSGVVWILVVGMALSNLGAIPLQSPTYGFVHDHLVPLAIPLLLLKADLRKVFRESGPVMLTFLVASIATVLGALAGFLLLDLGDMGARVAGVYTGGWIGGAVNMLAVSKAVEMTPTEFSVAISASNPVSVLALACLATLPTIGIVNRWLAPSASSERPSKDEQAASTGPTPNEFRLTHITGALALAWLICWVADALSNAAGLGQYAILVVTALTIAVANLFPTALSKLRGDFELGMLLMYLFFAVVGAGTDAILFLTNAPVLFFYGLIIVFVHLVAVLACAKLLGIGLPQAVVASGAALVGPAPTAAIASARGWRHLITPGIMCGIFGYAIANFVGVFVTASLS